nr:disease resistance protein TAO1-like isoform X2 [Malus domestica]
MELIGLIQVFNIIVIAIGTLFYMCCRSLTFSSSSSSAVNSAVADCAAVADDEDEDADIPPRREKYDVFISFRGEDTRLGITSHLRAALLQKKLETYIDNRLKRGEEIRPALLEAIEKSTISVIIFSQNYASSTWCLDELEHILECKERYGQMVIPIFFDINPSHVRNQHGSYADAFAQLEKRFHNSIHKVHKWRDVLTTAANLSGFDYSNKYGTEADLIQKVVDHIWIQLCRESSRDLNGFVGIESRIKQIELLLGIHSQDACITVGIWGMGGIGKTTLAEAVFRIHSSKFEASCILKNIREKSEQEGGLDHLEETLLKEILKEEVLPVGSTLVGERLSRTKVLIVLDDVTDSWQMERLVGDRLRYGSGSRIIITSRDRGTLGQTVEEAKIYEVEGLKSKDALQLFCLRAFKNNGARRTDFKELAEKVAAYAGRVPLALTVLGSLFYNCKSEEEWVEEFNKLKQFSRKDIQKVLRISYDGLEQNEKDIFLDIACFHKGKDVYLVKRKLASCGRFPKTGIDILINRCLISIDSKWGSEIIEMHDLLQEMGRTIVQEQCIKDPGKRSRLFTAEDVYCVLKSNTETPNVEAIRVDWSYIEKRALKRADFKKMSKLIMLIVDGGYTFTASLDLPDSLRYLEWWGYPLESLPSKFCSENLVELHMPYSKVKKLWKEEQILVNLQVINLYDSRLLTEIPGCFQHLHKFTRLELECCMSLKYLPEVSGNLQHLNLQSSGVKELPESVWSNENISYLNISHCKDLEKLPSNNCELKVSNVLGIESCTSLGEFSELPRDITKLSLVGFKRLVSLPTHICKLKNLKELNLYGCSELEKFPKILEPMEHLVSLRLQGTAVKMLPSSIGNLISLPTLDLSGCKHLVSLPTNICKLKNLKQLNLSGCFELENFPEILEPMEHLVSLCLQGTAVKMLPSSIGNLISLQTLDLCGCKHLVNLPTNICKLKYLEELNLSGCSELENFPEILEPMEHLVSLSLQGAAVKMLPSSIGNLISLQTLDLRGCKHLVSLPTNICKLKYLEELNLSGCSELENFPEIIKPMEHLKYLNLSGTTVKELPSSIEFLSALKRIKLQGCKRLSSIPKSICKLKCLEELNLSWCSTLRNFPEILEPMENLKSLNLSRTSVEQVYTSSIEFLPALKNIELKGCNKLSCISKSMLKYVTRPDAYETSESDDHGSEASEIEDDSDL